MDTFQRLKFENSSFYQKIKKYDASPEVQEALRIFTESKNKLVLQLETRIANYDFEGAIDILHEGCQTLENGILRLEEAVGESETFDTDAEQVENFIDTMEDDNEDVI